ncbi:MAG: cation:proton antiporter [Acidimicrobiia bacterium]|nr:cation:proton antiporter [Acidimicrobiia bacterium]
MSGWFTGNLAAASEVDFDGVLLVMGVAVAIPLLLALTPTLPLPPSVVEILAGIVIGPAVLGLVEPSDEVIRVMAKLGVAFLLFLAGLELDFHIIRGRPLKLGLQSFALSVALGILVTLPLGMADVIADPLFIGIVLTATSLGIVIPVLKDAAQLDTGFGHFVVVACSIAEFGSIVLLSLFFSGSGSANPLVTVLKLVVLVLTMLVVALLAVRAAKSERLNAALFKLQDSSSQIRIRVAVLLLLALLVITDDLGLDAILGAFMAGALLSALTDPEKDQDFGHFRHKLQGLGFGFFIPVFFVATGIGFPVEELFSDASTALRIPLFLLLLFVVRGVPALLSRRDISRTQVFASALMQSTSLSFIVVATTLGVSIGEVRPINAASLIAAGMLSVLIFPATALALLRGEERRAKLGLTPGADGALP